MVPHYSSICFCTLGNSATILFHLCILLKPKVLWPSLFTFLVIFMGKNHAFEPFILYLRAGINLKLFSLSMFIYRSGMPCSRKILFSEALPFVILTFGSLALRSLVLRSFPPDSQDSCVLILVLNYSFKTGNNSIE